LLFTWKALGLICSTKIKTKVQKTKKEGEYSHMPTELENSRIQGHKNWYRPDVVAHTCNPSYLKDGDWED
jgi:hypothetical protein